MGSSLFGRVWTALDVDTDEVVRVVVVDPELLPSEAARTAFLERMREVIEGLADALVPLKDVGSEGDNCVLIFGAPQGTFPLPDITAEMGLESRRHEARRFAVHLARSVAELHQKGVVHGLLDPSTVFEWERGYAVWQYEIARLCERDVIEIRLAGSPMDAYRAPEATVGDDLVPASDVYSWAALVAQFPSQESVYEAIAQINDGSAVEFFGEQLLELLKQALKEEPSERFTDGAALVAAIEAAGLHRELPISRAGTGNSVWEWELTRDRRRQKSLTAMRGQLAPSDRSWEYHEPELESPQDDVPSAVPEPIEASEDAGLEVAPAADNEVAAEAGTEVNEAEAASAEVDDAEVDDAGVDEVTPADQVRTEEAEQPGLPDYGDYAPDVTEGLEDDDEAAADRAVEEVADTLSPAEIAALDAQDAREAEALAQTEDRLEASRQSLEAREKLEAAIRLAARQAAQRRAEQAQAEQAAEQARAAEEARLAQAQTETAAGVQPVAEEKDDDLSAATRRASEHAEQQRELLAERARTQTTPDVRDDYETPAWALEAAERAAREVAEEAAREAEEAAAAEAEQAEQQARAAEEAEASRAAQQAAAIRDDDEELFNELLGETETESRSEPLERYDMGPLPPMPGEEFQAPKPKPVADTPVAARQAPSSPAVAARRRGVSAAERAKAEEAARIARERVRRSVANRRKPSGTYSTAEASGEVQKRALILNAPPESWGAGEPSLAMPITAPAVAQARQEAQPSPAAPAAASQPATVPAKQTIITETNEMTPAMKIMLAVLFALILIMMCNR